MKMSVEGKKFLKSVEQVSLLPYDDSVGVVKGKPIIEWVEGATIGYGHLIARNQWSRYKDGITQEKAEALFDKDLAPFETVVNESVRTTLVQSHFDALVLLAYNIGVDAFHTSSVVKILNGLPTGYNNLEDAWKAWNKSHGLISTGLMNRRQAEWNVWTKGEFKRW